MFTFVQSYNSRPRKPLRISRRWLVFTRAPRILCPLQRAIYARAKYLKRGRSIWVRQLPKSILERKKSTWPRSCIGKSQPSINKQNECSKDSKKILKKTSLDPSSFFWRIVNAVTKTRKIKMWHILIEIKKLIFYGHCVQCKFNYKTKSCNDNIF